MVELNSPAIIGKVAKSTGYRARDVRADIKELGFEKGIERAASLIAEENAGLRQSVAELTGIVDTLINRMGETVLINEHLVRQIDALRSRDKAYEAYKGEA